MVRRMLKTRFLLFSEGSSPPLRTRAALCLWLNQAVSGTIRCVDSLGWVTWGEGDLGADAGTQKGTWNTQVPMLLLLGPQPACVPVRKPTVLFSGSVRLQPGQEDLHSQLHSDLSFLLLSSATVLPFGTSVLLPFNPCAPNPCTSVPPLLLPMQPPQDFLMVALNLGGGSKRAYRRPVAQRASTAPHPEY